MTNPKIALPQLAAATFALLTMPAHYVYAQSGLDACGDIHVEADAQCEVVPPSAECEGMCTDVSVHAACSAKLVAQCDGGCNELPSVDCNVDCKAGCTASCEVDPGKFDCRGSCEADCSGRCEGGCAASSNKAECMASCEGSCSASCEGKCDVELPEADCEGKCSASCDGSCEVDANLDCQVKCQADARGDCELDVQGSCEVQCKADEGALFCDGNYVDHGNNLEQCLDALRNLEVRVEAMGEVHASGSASSDCSVVRAGSQRADAFGWALCSALVGLCLRRGKRRAAQLR